MKNIIRIILICIIWNFSSPGQNLIQNGSFSDSSTGWYLDYYGSALCSGTVTGGRFLISIQSPGEETWNVQFKQSGISIDSGALYQFSFEAAASQARAIEASISRDGGDYISYSGRDTLQVTPTRQRFEYIFLMRYPTDTSARVEFNCGLDDGTVSLSNIELIEIPGPLLTLQEPLAGAILYEGYPVAISWFSVANDSLKIELSTDNGLNWFEIASSVPESGPYIWTPNVHYSPWCLLRISNSSDQTIASVTEGVFEIAPRTELINNGNFANSDSGWNLGVYGGKASGSVGSDSIYRIQIDTAGNESWHTQFTQSGINLQNGISYILTYTAYAQSARTIRVMINMDGGTYENYIDSSQTLIDLTTEPQQFTVDFAVSQDSDLAARLEFNCGLDDADVFIGNVSLTKKYVARARPFLKSVRRSPHIKSLLTVSHDQFRLFTKGQDIFRSSLIDLMGRPIGAKGKTPNFIGKNAAPGLYILRK